jgi:inosine-uridine nucleoside N-ribohydrolase
MKRIAVMYGALAIAATLAHVRAAPARVSVWIDTDPAIGEPERDVDDGLALVQAFHSPELDIRGVSVVFGNASLDRGLPIARRLVKQFGPPRLQVFAGAAGAADGVRETDASRALAAALRKEPLTILALGPVTNVAAVLRRHPDLATSTLNWIRRAFERCSTRRSSWCWRLSKSRRRCG